MCNYYDGRRKTRQSHCVCFKIKCQHMLPHNYWLSRSSLRVCFNVSGNDWVDFALFWCVSVFVRLCVPIKARRARRHPKTTLTRHYASEWNYIRNNYFCVRERDLWVQWIIIFTLINRLYGYESGVLLGVSCVLWWFQPRLSRLNTDTLIYSTCRRILCELGFYSFACNLLMACCLWRKTHLMDCHVIRIRENLCDKHIHYDNRTI